MAATRSRITAQIAVAAMTLGALGAGAGSAPAAMTHHASRALKAFPSCRAVVRYARHNARRTGGTTGLPTLASAPNPLVLEAPTIGPPNASQTSAPQAAETAVPDVSGTNVQEAGVDESDIVKTDGKRIFAVADRSLHALDVTGTTPKLVGSLKLDGYGHEIFLRGDRVLVMTTSEPFFAGDIGVSPDVQTTLTEVDVSNPAAMTVRRTLRIGGALVAARLTGSLARIVIASSPDPVAEKKIARTRLRHWVPRTVLRSKLSGRTYRHSIARCRSIRRPRSFAGLDLLTVMSFDLDKGLYSVDRDAILAGAETVYASPTSLYVASRTYNPAIEQALEDGAPPPAQTVTEIHRFAAAADGETRYRSSGAVRGFVLNQFALSEHDGVLRVASTSDPEQLSGDAGVADSQSYVTVLDERGSKLVKVGRVGGLGKGEQIFAVRFVGDRGYVVTFRQTDPLYTLDLAKPSDPRVVGELKIRGYSAYLHPVSETELLGVGQDATKGGTTLGTQLSLFDVSDASKPVRRAHITLADGSSEAEFDHHAFLFWKPAGLAVIPLSLYGSDDVLPFEGAVGFRVGAASLSEVRRVTHPVAEGGDIAPPIGRSLVIGDKLYTLSYEGIAASRLDTLGSLSFTAFPTG